MSKRKRNVEREEVQDSVADRPSSTVRGSTPRFPEEPPSSMQETIQRAMAVVKESSLLIPLFPAVEAHFRRTKSTIRVYKERGVVRHAESSSTMVDSSESGGFDKESIRIGSPADDAVDLRSRGYQSEAHRTLRIGTQTPGTFEYSDDAALPTLEHQLVTYVTADDKEAFSQPGARSDADAAASATAAAQKCASQLQASPEL
ncbi:Dead deah box helicase [Lasiodiplodia theobromae]|uniref:Dead deah box helicase n=1 Tax=Lasiodiplodia theobromae TaxID=45133 RepID=UPI0015C3438B|nr:Dead deah box helicase [Lasiodiplodia theobromae]KAF4537845.1 Dead deah box helicase [Lasiodiplodia theobromae]